MWLFKCCVGILNCLIGCELHPRKEHAEGVSLNDVIFVIRSVEKLSTKS